jgi:plastocyanin
MDSMKSRRWIAAAVLAAAVVFLVMVTGERGPAEPNAAPAPVSSSEAVRASDGGPPDDNAAAGADRADVIDAMNGLLDALGISAEELAGGADCGNGDNGGEAQSGSDDAGGTDCGKSDPAAADPGGSATITISGFAFGQPLTVAPRATVEVVNTDAAPHNVTAADGSFDTPDLARDETATFTAPNKPGRYEFTCTLHPEMTGTLIVEGDAGGSSAGDRANDQGRTRSTEPPADSQQGDDGADTSGGDRDGARSQHQTPTPGRENSNGSSDGY